MDYTVIARRFRPQSFADVVGQERVAQALRNAIAADRVAHAYLFTGARGVGKTSMARILAKTLNCPNSTGGDPCHTCDICQAIAAGSDIDVLEIDGASNRGIEDIRALRSNVTVRSMRSPNKIYIIDEVHMLTREAFNALLKTLEEPPGNVKFIFCTTEPNKVPETILSRCQRFDFGTIATHAIRQRLAEIATAEGVAVEPAAVELVARRAAGSMRDSQSLFDQLLAFGGKQISAGDVHRLLGTAPDERLIELFSAIVHRQSAAALDAFDSALASGAQLTEFTDQMVAYTRDVMIVAAGAAITEPLSVSVDAIPQLQQHASAWGLRTAMAALQILAEAKQKMRGVAYGRVLAELALVRLTVLEDLESLADLVAAVRNGGSLQVGAPGGTATESRPVRGSVSSAPRLVRVEAPKSKPVEAHHPVEAQTGNQTLGFAAGTSAPPASGAVSKPVKTVPLEPGREKEFWDAVLAACPDSILSHAKVANPAAISGPNQLVVLFAKRYDTQRRFLELPEQTSRLKAVLAQVAGQPVGVNFETDPLSSSQPIEEKRVKKSDETPLEVHVDPFTQRVLDLFSGSVTRSEPAAPRRAD